MLPTIHSLQKPFSDLSANVVLPVLVIADTIGHVFTLNTNT
jgi:hypothetical protein